MQKADQAAPVSIEEDPFFAQDLEQMARATNYRRWQFRLIAPYVKGKVLEIGGGIGNFTPGLARTADSVVSVEPNAYCHQKLVDKTKALPNVSTLNVTAELIEQRLPAGYQADTVVCMNVLEHLQDDMSSVRSFTRTLKVGGLLVLLVPAVQSLFGEIDQRLGHYRRYSRRSIRTVVQAAGLSPVRIRYFNFIGLAAWWWNARIARSQTQNDSQIWVFDKCIVPWQSRLERLIPAPIGQSLLVVAARQAVQPGS